MENIDPSSGARLHEIRGRIEIRQGREIGSVQPCRFDTVAFDTYGPIIVHRLAIEHTSRFENDRGRGFGSRGLLGLEDGRNGCGENPDQTAAVWHKQL